jgi:hypothetical protein
MAVSDALYRMRRVEVRWGDYGEILHHGISWNRERVDGVIQLERTGPFIPALSMPSTDEVVIVDDLRHRLCASDLHGFVVRPVVKRKVVRLEWETWPHTDEPAQYPAGGEPENYVLRRKHDDRTAEALGALWELTAACSVQFCTDDANAVFVDQPARDFFSGSKRHPGVYVSARAREWFAKEVPECVAWDAVRLVPA